MNQLDKATATSLLATALKTAFQLGYVTPDGTLGRAEAEIRLGVGAFEVAELSIDVIGAAQTKVDELRLVASFASDRTFEIVEAVADPIGLFVPSTNPKRHSLLQFHHVGAYVDDLVPYVSEAKERGLDVVQLRAPAFALDIAFIDLSALIGHRLELLCPQA